MKILAILANPSKKSYCNALLQEYIRGAKKNNEVKTLYLGDLKFDPILKEGYRKIQKLESDLKKAQKLIRWANKIVLVYPTWWTTYPALLKGFFDRTLIPGFGFKYTGPRSWLKLLEGKTARVIVTMGSPSWYYKFIMGDPGYKAIKGTLGFCGISPIQKTYIDNIELKTPKQRESALKQVYKIGLGEK